MSDFIEVPVTVGRMGSPKTCRTLPVKIKCENVSEDVVKQQIRGRAITIELSTDPSTADPVLPGMEDAVVTIQSNFDVPTVSSTDKQHSFRLKFPDDKTQEVLLLECQDLWLRILDSKPIIKQKGPRRDDETDDHDDVGPMARRRTYGEDDPAKTAPIMELERYGVVETKCTAICDAFNITTMSQFFAKMAENEWWHRDVKGVGVAAVDKIVDAVTAWRRDNPIPEPESEPEQQGALCDDATDTGGGDLEDQFDAAMEMADRPAVPSDAELRQAGVQLKKGR